MTSFLNVVKQKAWLALLPLLLMTALIGNAQAAPTASFSAAGAGTTSNLTLTATVNVADADLGVTGNYYAGFSFENNWYFLTPQGWTPYTLATGAVPVLATTTLYSGAAVLFANTDLSSYVGAQLYIGYGKTESAMLANATYSMVYTVTANAVKKGPAAVLLGTSGNFAILAKSAISTVPASAITGDVGVSPAATSFLTGFSLTMVGTTSATSPQVTGSLFGADMSPPTNTNLTTAVLGSL